jgi:hypothetical protein
MRNTSLSRKRLDCPHQFIRVPSAAYFVGHDKGPKQRRIAKDLQTDRTFHRTAIIQDQKFAEGRRVEIIGRQRGMDQQPLDFETIRRRRLPDVHARRLARTVTGLHELSHSASDRLQHWSVRNPISACMVSKLAL